MLSGKDLKCLLFHFRQYVFCIQVLLKEECGVYNYKRVCSWVGVYVFVSVQACVCVCVCIVGINRDKELEESRALACCSSCQM